MGSGGKQQELEEVMDDSRTITWQEKILNFYNSDDLIEVAVGYWLKLLVEALIVGIPLFVIIVLPGFSLVYLNIGPFNYGSVFTGWFAISTTVLAFSWCFTEATAGDRGDEENE